MSAEDPIALYLRELRAHLGVRRLARRRILDEVHAHLAQSVSDLERRGLSPAAAAMTAIDRFGAARQVAAQFEAGRQRGRLTERRLVTLWVAWIAAMAMGSATVWAAVQGPEAPAGRLQPQAGDVSRSAGPGCGLCRSKGATSCGWTHPEAAFTPLFAHTARTIKLGARRISCR